jgi:HipA N-terminal domain
MDREALVYVDLEGVPHLMGRLWARVRKNKESATFEYDEAWLQHPARFSLEPALQLGPGPFHTPADTPMFGAIGDSAPDRWGRALMRRMERRRAEREGGEDDNTASLALALDVAGYFELDAAQAREIAGQVGKAVSKWRDEAARRGLSKTEIDRMASAFEHKDLRLASGRQ